MITVATALWDANVNSQPFSRCYDESWVEKLYRGFARNLTQPFRFVCFSDRYRDFAEPIEQEPLLTSVPSYGCYIEPFRLGVPMILAGLDTIIVGNVDHLAERCLKPVRLALPRDPYAPGRACNGVALIPWGQEDIYNRWRSENDMEWLRQQPHEFIDDLFPDEVVSFKVHVRDRMLHGPPTSARVVYFHGVPKPSDIADVPWVRRHWK